MSSANLTTWDNIFPNITETAGTDPVTGDPIIRIKVLSNSDPKKFIRIVLPQP